MIGKFEPLSKICNVFGYHNSELTLKDREWKCPDRKTKHEIDINASINIKKFALIDQNLIGIEHLWNAGCMGLGLVLKRERNEPRSYLVFS